MVLSTCSLFNNEPDYNIPIVWKSNLSYPYPYMTTQDETGIYFFNNSHDNTGHANWSTLRLNKINPETGKILWSTRYFEKYLRLYQPIITDNYIYVPFTYYMSESQLPFNIIILCFDKENGTQLAKVYVTIDGQNIKTTSDYWLYNNYFYFGCCDENDVSYLVRLDIGSIVKDGNLEEQILEVEKLWQSSYSVNIIAAPLVYNDIVYCNTDIYNDDPVELVGININTKEEIFYYSFIVNSPYNSFDDSLYIEDEILYLLGDSIAAFDLINHNKIYHIIFDYHAPPEENYSLGSNNHRNISFYNNMIYYSTKGIRSPFGNSGIKWHIFCVSTEDGRLVWFNTSENFEELSTNLVVYNNKVFMTHDNGLRVYNANNGEFLGSDKNIKGGSYNYNILYGSTMITIIYNYKYPNGQIIALDLR